MSVRIMVSVAAAASLLAGAAPAFAGDMRPAPAVFSPLTAAQVPVALPAPAKRRVGKKTDIAEGAALIGLVAAAAAVGGIVAGTSSSTLPATTN